MKRLLEAATAVAAALVALVSLPVAPAAPATFRFCILGDRTGEAQDGVYEQVWREIDLFHPDFVMNTGDTIQGGNDATAGQEWEQVRKIWQRYRSPVFFVAGNHDIWSAESQTVYTKYTGRPPFYSFDWQQAHFTVLDNSRSEHLSGAQLSFLEQDLEKHREQRPKFVLFHQPMDWLIPLKFQSDFALHRLLRKYAVAMVISGHTHQFARMEKDGIVYLCAASSGGHLRGTAFAQGWFYGHVRATVTGAKVQLTVKEVGSPYGKGRSFDAADWGDGGLKLNFRMGTSAARSTESTRAE